MAPARPAPAIDTTTTTVWRGAHDMASTRTRKAPRRAARRAPEAGAPRGDPAPESRVGAPRALDPEALLSILDAIPARLAYMDGRRRYRFVNAEYAQAVHARPEELLGRSAAQVLGRTNARHYAPVARAALEGRTSHGQS